MSYCYYDAILPYFLLVFRIGLNVFINKMDEAKMDFRLLKASA